MSDIRLTEERLRHHLDTNQFKREALCVAVLPFLGSYTSVKPRRPKGGPDGRRDIEAIFDGEYIVWGGVGFRNGGGSDRESRKEASKKYKSDLKAALKEKTDLTHFVFFTNVDLTPGQITELKQFAEEKGIAHTDVFDMNRLRSTLDSPEGLIARLQYLDIEMSKTDQLGLINKFGDELQAVFTSRIDRVDITLSRMESFLDFQKPLIRTLFLCEIKEASCSGDIENEALYIEVEGLAPGSREKTDKLLIFSNATGSDSKGTFSSLAFQLNKCKPATELRGIKQSLACENLFGMMDESMTSTGGFGVVTLAKIFFINVRVLATPKLARLISRFKIICNQYEIVDLAAEETDNRETLILPKELVFPEEFTCPHEELELTEVIPKTHRNLIDSPPVSANDKFTRSEL